MIVRESDKYETPPEVFGELNLKYGPFSLDVCAEAKTAKCKNFYKIEDDSLEMDWAQGNGSRGWMNPPYSNPRPWIEKAIMEARLGFITCALLPADTSTKWFHDLVLNNPRCKYEFWPKRIRFLKNGKRCESAKFGSLVAIFF